MKAIVSASLEARKKAHAPYSEFHVGAALETSAGTIFPGCNIENASYSLTMCAERTAIFSAIAAGERDFSQLAIASEEGVSPCGACRQVIWELCGDIKIILVNSRGEVKETTAAQLLPHAFDAHDLNT